MKPTTISTPEGKARVLAAEPRWKAKFILRTTLMILDFLAIILSAAVSGTQRLALVFNFIPLGTSFFWCLANVIVRLRRPRPMHPGANVGMDLVLWMAFVFVLLSGWSWVATVTEEFRYYELEGESVAQLQNDVRVQTAAEVFTTFSGVLHFVLFVWACVDTSKRNKAELNFRRMAIAEKMQANDESRRRASGIQPTTGSQLASDPGSRKNPYFNQPYDGVDISSISIVPPVSPPDSPGPSGLDPIHASRPGSPQQSSKTGFFKQPTTALSGQ